MSKSKRIESASPAFGYIDSCEVSFSPLQIDSTLLFFDALVLCCLISYIDEMDVPRQGVVSRVGWRRRRRQRHDLAHVAVRRRLEVVAAPDGVAVAADDNAVDAVLIIVLSTVESLSIVSIDDSTCAKVYQSLLMRNSLVWTKSSLEATALLFMEMR